MTPGPASLSGTSRMKFAYLCGCGRWSFTPDVCCEEESEPTEVIPTSIMDDEIVFVPSRGSASCEPVRPSDVMRAVLDR